MRAREHEGPVVIIEGADGTGKTTLAEAFEARGYTRVHQGPYEEDPFWETLFLIHNRPGKLVLDRSHIGEQVYGPLYRDGDALGHARRRMIERYLLARQAVVVLADPPYAKANANWAAGKKAGEEMFLDNTGHWKSHRRFHSLSSTMQDVQAPISGPGIPPWPERPRTELPVVRYDYTDWPKDELGGFIELVKDARPDYNQGPGVGRWSQGGVLLVGFRENPRNPLSLPFVADDDVAPWLAAQLDAWGVPESELYWVNAEDEHGRETDGRFVNRLYPRKVIALGDEAQRWVKRRDLMTAAQAAHVPHPADWKRHHFDKEYPLRQELRK